MKGKFNLITAKARKDKRLKFTSLIHNVNEDNLAACYQELKGDKACGIDNITVEDYGCNFRENINNLLECLNTKRYKLQPVKRIYILNLVKWMKCAGLIYPQLILTVGRPSGHF